MFELEMALLACLVFIGVGEYIWYKQLKSFWDKQN